MKINKKKSGIIFYKKRMLKENENNEKEIAGFPIVREYKYLGVWIDEKLNFNKLIEEIESKLKKSIKMVNIMKWKKSSVWKTTYAWMTYALPHLRYGSLIYHDIRNDHEKKRNNIFKRMETLLRRTVKDMYNFPKNTSNELIKKIMGNWNMKTLTLSSYVRSAKIWIA